MAKAVILVLFLMLATISVVSSTTGQQQCISDTPSSKFFKENIRMIRSKADFMESQWFADLSLINFLCRDEYDACLKYH